MESRGIVSTASASLSLDSRMMFTRLMLTRNLRRALPDVIGILAANQQSRFLGFAALYPLMMWQRCQQDTHQGKRPTKASRRAGAGQEEQGRTWQRCHPLSINHTDQQEQSRAD
jgi:hypothetical protein